jgi:diguanylate cyclase (GGDEF)-like protein
MTSPADRPARSSVEERYRTLLETGRILTSTLSMEELFLAMHSETAKVLSADTFSVSLADPSREGERVVFRVEHGLPAQTGSALHESNPEGVRPGSGLLVTDDPDQLVAVLGRDGPGGRCRSGIAAPMVHHGRSLGTLAACSPDPATYNSDDLALLQGIADVAAIAVDNALQFAEIERRRTESERIEEIGRALTSERDPNEVLVKVVEAVLDVLSVDGAAVWQRYELDGPDGRITDSAGEIALPVGAPWTLAGALGQSLLEERKPAIIDDIEASSAIPEHLREYLQAGSGIGVPIVVDDEVVGVLAAGSRQTRRFGPEETAIMQRLARQASVALENARLHESLRALSLTDPLTGLPNRRQLQLHLEREVAAARRGRSIAVVVWDIDHFKHVNDTHGHLAGDEILKSFAAILLAEQRTMNLVGRFGGDEFVSVLSESDFEGARQYGARVQAAVTADPVMSPLGVSCSMGIATFAPDRMSTVADLVREADGDMYRAKQARRAGAPGTGASGRS